MMRLMYFPVNCAYAYVFGDDPNTMNVTSMGLDDQRWFNTKAEALQAARECGLGVRPNGRVYIPKSEETD